MAYLQDVFGWQGNLGLAIIDPRDRDSGHTLARRARRTLSLDLDRQFGRLGLGATWQAVSGSYDDEKQPPCPGRLCPARVARQLVADSGSEAGDEGG
nr:hypothetical protein GCM10020185_43080 [Pseudomonas brassicacearum subsp. brassicacearum]